MSSTIEVECDGCTPPSRWSSASRRRATALLLALGLAATYAAGVGTGVALHADDPCAGKALHVVNSADFPSACLALDDDRVRALGDEAECPNACDRYLHRQHKAYEDAALTTGRRLFGAWGVTTERCHGGWVKCMI